ncbi:PREDICTED: putative leucine-rich repeat receptor-like serine/threonine-protein kinase At2g24130 [Tarenaya hassleriana]|uniref:putative leucine-rich repeat receptor-like serine/threonine-protein kinase At2g24130 n=1 Tax=Tarenaya hassleriana TaxID=28532 RepID=UPI0008FCE588|nr:PREDICTED: putative leucine-rich repeat receptor-like serine/threonine-protein kinase At2g24130 [Tarenaya hassleriana]
MDPTIFFSGGFLLLLLLGSADALTSASDVAALKAFKAGVNPRSIPPWSCLATWDFAAADPCASPRRTHFTCGVTCSPDSTRVTQLTLDPAGYSGRVTPLVSGLTHLLTLDLAENSFFGQIPPSISSLVNLQFLNLRSNSLSGSLPESITRLNSLESIDISHNSLTGSLPKSMGSMPNLRRLDLSYNKLTGSIPKLPKNLIELALKANSLSGSVPKDSFTDSTQLEVVEIAENSFTGVLGAWFFLLPSIQQADLANNSLTGVEVSPPSPAGSSGDLVAVELGFNAIEGHAPANFAAYPRLSSLSLRHNRLRGGIPAEYGQSKTLRRLYLDGNFLTGKPPAGFIRPDSPVYGSFGDNCLQGCPGNSKMCAPSQKPFSICKQAYGGKPRS